MGEFDRFGQRKLPQIALQTAILVTLPIIWANFRDLQQCSHSDGALTEQSTSLPDSFLLLQQRQRVVRCNQRRMFILTGQLDLYK